MYSHNRDKDQFEDKARELDKLSQALSAKHILYGASDLYFEAQRFIARIKRDIESNCLTYHGGIELIIEQIDHLHEQDVLLTFERAKIYIVVEKKSNQPLTEHQQPLLP